MLGDAINDEIRIRGEVYRISTCTELSSEGSGGSGAVIDWKMTQLPISTNGQNIFPLEDAIIDPESTFLTVNSVLYAHGEHKDYHLNGPMLIWHGAFELEPSDKIIIRYPITIYTV